MNRLIDALLTPLVPLSFGAPGLALRRRTFASLERLDGQHVVITGANRGIGRAAAEALVGLGAHVTLVCRDEASGAEVCAAIARASGRDELLALERCDVSDLVDIRALAQRLRGPIDVLIHNAGTLPASRLETSAGLELTWATHVAGPHLFTRLLSPKLTPHAKVIWVSSGGMYLAPLVAPGTVPDAYDGVRAYALTKRAQVALAELWAERIPAGPTSVSMHPGWADTASVRTSLPRFFALTRPLLRTPASGADTIGWLAATPRDHLVPGGFYFDRMRRATHLAPWQRDRAELRDALWRWCEDLALQHGAIMA